MNKLENGKKMKQFSIDFDRDYGVSKRTGWSITEDGTCLVELEKHLILALIKWIRKRRILNES